MKKRDRHDAATLAVCDRCGCLLPQRVLVDDDWGTVCASLIRCEKRRRERLATGSALQSLALEELR